ncbi:MAG: hypothetical protein P8020_17090 [Acidobacteriota bacterium]|jgi:hypothetical protein
MTRKTGVVLGGVMWLMLWSPLVWAISVRTVNIQEMVDLSGTIFYGRCLSAVDSVAESGLGIRTYRFLVLDGLKNAEAGQTIEFREVSSMGEGVTIPGIPQFQKGQELLLFLHAESKSGLTSPVGIQQGVFRAEPLQNGEIGFTNGFGNRNLNYEMKPQVQAQAGLQGLEVQALGSGAPVPLSVFRDVVKKLDRSSDQTQGRVQ